MTETAVNLHLAAGAMERLGVRRTMFYRLVREGILKPAGKNMYGQYLFTDDAIDEARQALHERRFAIVKPA